MALCTGIRFPSRLLGDCKSIMKQWSRERALQSCARGRLDPPLEEWEPERQVVGALQTGRERSSSESHLSNWPAGVSLHCSHSSVLEDCLYQALALKLTTFHLPYLFFLRNISPRLETSFHGLSRSLPITKIACPWKMNSLDHLQNPKYFLKVPSSQQEKCQQYQGI